MDTSVIIRKYRPADPSLISAFQMKIYEKQYKFKPIFEYYLVSGIAEFLKNPLGSQLWVAENEAGIVGSIAIVREYENTAHLRWFAVDESMQGKGIGKSLVNKALSFCNENGYDNIVLWTTSILKSARHIYSKNGFTITETKENVEWTDAVLTEEKWEKHLQKNARIDRGDESKV